MKKEIEENSLVAKLYGKEGKYQGYCYLHNKKTYPVALSWGEIVYLREGVDNKYKEYVMVSPIHIVYKTKETV